MCLIDVCVPSDDDEIGHEPSRHAAHLFSFAKMLEDEPMAKKRTLKQIVNSERIRALSRSPTTSASKASRESGDALV